MVASRITLAQLRDQRDISPLIGDVLDRVRVSTGGDIRVADFLFAVSNVGRDSPRLSSASAWAKVAPGSTPEASRTNPQNILVSKGLADAFDAARALRRRIPGRDKFIGLRHVLASICKASARTAIFSEFREYLARVNLSDDQFREVLLADILSAPEPGEDPAEWKGYFLGTKESEVRAQPKLERDNTAPLVEIAVAPSSLEALDPSPPSPVEASSAIDADILPQQLESPVGVVPNGGADAPGLFARSADEPSAIFAVAGSDDPLNAEITDRIGGQLEAEAFAMLATAKAFKPPIAIGVFGEWGAGKTFFLRLLRDHVKEIAERSGDENSAFHRDVVPITFNAWHYVETNLWASLVDHIFTELDNWSSQGDASKRDSLLDVLSSSRAFTIESAESLLATRQEQQDAFARLNRAQVDLEAAKKNIGNKLTLATNAAWNQLWASARDKKEIEKAAKHLGMSNALNSAEELADSLKELDDEIGRLGESRGVFWRAATTAGVLTVTAISIVVVPYLFQLFSQRVLGLYNDVVAAIAGLAVPIIAVAGYVRTTATSALKGLQKVRPILDDARAEGRKAEEAALAPGQAELKEKSAAVAEAKAVFERANERLAQASTEYAVGTGRGKLLSFVRERVAAESYGRHLGFIATVRRDFESLSVLMADADNGDREAEEAAALHIAEIDGLIARGKGLFDESELKRLEHAKTAVGVHGRPFRRIVLFVDDLDRCPPKKVVEVLQAIHLLLAFPLFVVFVAVDVRWLRKSLEGQYGELLGDLEVASAFDYLEKIFQVPYWVRSLDAASAQDILLDRITLRTERADAFSVPQQVERNDLSEEVAAPEMAREAVEALADEEVDQGPQPLSFTAAEAAFLEVVAPCLVVSPRRILRFVNTYNIIKASLPIESRLMLEGSGFAACMTLLAILVSVEEGSSVLLEAVKSPSSTIDDLLQLAVDEVGREAVTDLIREYRRRGGDVGGLREHVKTVERFSFSGVGRR